MTGIHHVAVLVADLERAEAFYGRVLGLPVVRRWDDDRGHPRSVWFGLDGGAFIAVERAVGQGSRPTQAPGWHCVALAIAPHEKEAWRQRLTQAAVPVERESSYTLYVRDPDGNLVGLSHFPSN